MTKNNILEPLSNYIELEKQFEAIIESSDDAILSKDLDGIVRSWNPAAERIFGYTAEEIVGKSVTILIPAGHDDEEPKILGRLRRGEKIDHYETIRQRKDGTLLNVSLTVSPIKNAEGKIVGASKIARDITGQKQAEEKVRVARKELADLNADLENRVKERTESLNGVIAQMEEFSYSVSHDLRSPVRAMQAYAKAMLEDFGPSLDAMGVEYLNRIIRSGTRMDKLILDLLTYSKVARAAIELTPVEPETLIRDIVENYPEMQSPKAAISVAGPLPRVIAHEPSLLQVFSNLLSNAVKFVSAGTLPKVTIWAERRGANVRIFLRDNGIGIDPSVRDRMFGMFERGNQGGHYEGTGIGLAIVKKALERMHGSVGMAPESKAGSLFWIELPGIPE